ncbi:MAG: NAD(FAD)-dependent dehydrogenase [Candidatus Altiarchaeales archaeon ex4484_2]|nr:MAG: NAD(FAD)-dependent dehydrogenase [Candidatus Altiarchaeales archaeon ex4484_2]
MSERVEKLVCIVCPNSCEMEVHLDGDEIKSIQGNLCPRGIDYVRKELLSPERNIASTIEVSGGVIPLVSVKSAKEIPRERIMDVMDALAGVRVKAPVKAGDILVENVAGTGVEIVATKNVLSDEKENN